MSSFWSCFRPVSLSLLLLLAIAWGTTLGVTPPAHADCTPTLPNDDTVCAADDLDGFNLTGAGLNSFTVNQGVTVSGGAADAAVFIEGDVVVFLNDGTIQGTNFPQAGVDVNAIGSGGFTNNGTIEGVLAPSVFVATNADGPIVNGPNAFIFGVEGIAVENNITSLTNYGEIFSLENSVRAESIEVLTNFGLIDSLGDGIDVDGGTNSNDPNSAIGLLINRGTIRGDDDGIDVGTLTSLINAGTISGGFDGSDESGIAAAEIVSIVNSGTIETGGDITFAYAFEERETSDTQITLNAGSILIGRIDLGGGTNTLSIGSGLSLNSTFESDGGASDVAIGTIDGHLVATAPVTLNGGNEVQVVAVDQSAFTDTDDALLALIQGVSHVVRHAQAEGQSTRQTVDFASRFAAAEATVPSAINAFEAGEQSETTRAWAQTFGSVRRTSGTQTGGDLVGINGGLLAGYDHVLADNFGSVGVFVGLAADRSENDTNTQTTQSQTFIAGLHANGVRSSLQWDAMLTLGRTMYDQERVVANNQVAGGLETAEAAYNGWFVTPQLTITREASNPFANSSFGAFAGGTLFEQSFTVAYVGHFLDGYTETGTTNPLTVEDRSAHYALASAGLSLPFERSYADGSASRLSLLASLDGQARLSGDSVRGTLLGQSVSTDLSDEDLSLSARTGFSLTHETPHGMTAFVGAQLGLATTASVNLTANAGIRIAF